MIHVYHDGEEKRVVEHLQVEVRSQIGPGVVGTEEVRIWEDGGMPGDEPDYITFGAKLTLEEDLMVNLDNFDIEAVDMDEAELI